MAGGRGVRLEELTRETPKPMLRVGSRPLLETIVREYVQQGFRNFWLAVNYKAEQIESHFGDGAAFGANIRYLRERERLGTAGALEPARRGAGEPFIVTNADLLTKEDYGDMVDRHVASGADATMAVRDYEMQVPFGSSARRMGGSRRSTRSRSTASSSRPGSTCSRRKRSRTSRRTRCSTCPSLFETLAQNGKRTRCHPIDGYWLDIGRADRLREGEFRLRRGVPVIGARRVLAVIPGARRLEGPAGQEHPAGAWPAAPRLDRRCSRAARALDRIVVSSDSDAILAAARACGVEALRPACRAGDRTPRRRSTVIEHALNTCPGHDVVVVLQPTSPLRTAADIDAALERFVASGAPSCVSVCEAEQSPYWMYRLGDDQALLPIVDGSAAGDAPARPPAVYVLNGAVYVADAAWLRSTRAFVAAGTVAHVMPVERSLDIDTAHDFERFQKTVSETSHA
jgi:CMP-N-acetylneuraminic acid synthetase/GTP:adenosylcobinamide-phosphate guanylyltransferase